MFVLHGAPKLFAGPEKWSGLGMAVSSLGVPVTPAFWGFMASFSEFFGGICLALGLFSRIASSLLLVTMGVAASWHLRRGNGLTGSSHPIELGVAFLFLLLVGAGRFSLDARLQPLRRLMRRTRGSGRGQVR